MANPSSSSSSFALTCWRSAPPVSCCCMLGGSGGLARLIFQAQNELSSQRPRAVSMCRQSPSMHSVQGRGTGEGGSRHCGRVVYRWVQDGGSSALLSYGHTYSLRFGKWSRLGQRHGLRSTTLTYSFYKNIC
jgi:hypothetical protein